MKGGALTSSGFGFLPKRTSRINMLGSQIAQVFQNYGYGEVTLPTYEYYDSLKSITLNFSDERVITFTERKTGKFMVLRPDFTPQICRIVAGYYKDCPPPVRLFYCGTVFRNLEDNEKSEKLQIGCELYGLSEFDGDIELLLCLKSALKSVNLNDYRIIIGDSAFLLRLYSLLRDSAAEYFDILLTKKLSELNNFVDNGEFSEDLKKLLIKLPHLFGNIDTLLELVSLSSFDNTLYKRSRYMEKLFKRLISLGFSKDILVYDAGETRGLDYYTGLNFNAVHTLSGSVIGGGGRYDSLMKKFNLSYSACGMGLDLNLIDTYSLGDYNGFEYDWIVVGNENLEKAEELRAEGYSVIFISESLSVENFTRFIKAKNILNNL